MALLAVHALVVVLTADALISVLFRDGNWWIIPWDWFNYLDGKAAVEMLFHY
jgi:hypothetical protein